MNVAVLIATMATKLLCVVLLKPGTQAAWTSTAGIVDPEDWISGWCSGVGLLAEFLKDGSEVAQRWRSWGWITDWRPAWELRQLWFCRLIGWGSGGGAVVWGGPGAWAVNWGGPGGGAVGWVGTGESLSRRRLAYVAKFSVRVCRCTSSLISYWKKGKQDSEFGNFHWALNWRSHGNTS